MITIQSVELRAIRFAPWSAGAPEKPASPIDLRDVAE